MMFNIDSVLGKMAYMLCQINVDYEIKKVYFNILFNNVCNFCSNCLHIKICLQIFIAYVSKL